MIQPIEISSEPNYFLEQLEEKRKQDAEGDVFFFCKSNKKIGRHIGLCSYYKDSSGKMKYFFKWSLYLDSKYKKYNISHQYTQIIVSKESFFYYLKNNHPEHFEWILFNQDILK